MDTKYEHFQGILVLLQGIAQNYRFNPKNSNLPLQGNEKSNLGH